MRQCRKSSFALLLALSVLLAACQPGNINRVSLPYLSKGMSPEAVQAVLKTPAKCSLVLQGGDGLRFDVYRLVSASYSVNYLLMFDRKSGGLRYWGSPSEFHRQRDDGLSEPAQRVSRFLQRKPCGAGELWMLE